MDFHSLGRRDLQALCKKNRIPANISNVAMADALLALHSVEGIEDIQEASSPYADAPPTSRCTSAHRAAASLQPKDQPASPLPRARRVTARSSAVRRLVDDHQEENEKNEEGLVEEAVPMTPAVERGVPKPRGTTATKRNARSRASKKEDEEEAFVETVKKTPATRRTRHSAADATPSTVRRSARLMSKARARAAASEMEALAQEEEEVEVKQVEDDAKTKTYVEGLNEDSLLLSDEKMSDLASGKVSDHHDQNIDSGGVDSLDIKDGSWQLSDEKSSDLTAENVSDICSIDLQEKFEEEEEKEEQEEEAHDKIVCSETCEQEEGCDVIVEDSNIPQHKLAVIDAKRDDGMVQETEEFCEEQVPEEEEKEDSCGDNVLMLSGLEGSPVRGLVSSLENLGITDAAASAAAENELSKKEEEEEEEEEEMNVDLLPRVGIPNETNNSGILDHAPEIKNFSAPTTGFSNAIPVANDDASLEPVDGDEVTASSPLQQIPMHSPISTVAELPADMLAGVGYPTGESTDFSVVAKTTPGGSSDARNIIFGAEKSKNKSVAQEREFAGTNANKSQFCDAGKENKDLAQLIMTEVVGCGEAKVSTEAERQGSRKVKMVSKEKCDVKKVEGKRSALAELNENTL